MIKLYLKNTLKLLIIMFVILLNNIKIKGCLCCVVDRGKVVVFCDNYIDLPNDDSIYKKINDFIIDPKNHKEEHEETYHEILHYKPLNIDKNIKITEKDIKDIIDKEIDNIKNRTINIKKKEENDDKKKENDKEKEDKQRFIPKNLDNDKIGSKLGNIRFLYIIENDEIIPVKPGKFYFEEYYDTENRYNHYKKTYIDYWYDKYFKKEVYNFENLKKFWNENKPDYMYCKEFHYPVFLFKKNKDNYSIFERERKNRNCSGLS